MDEIRWMRAVLRLYAVSDVGTWTDEEVIESFAVLRVRPGPFAIWAARLTPPPPAAPADDGSAEALVAVARATAPNLKVEVQNG